MTAARTGVGRAVHTTAAHRPRGFTLIETVLALAITTVVLAAVGGVVRRAADGRAEVSERVDTLAGGRLLLGMLADELEASEPGSLAIEMDDDTGIRIDLTTASADGAPVAVRYHLDGARLLRATRSPFAADEIIVRDPVLDGIAELGIDCFDGQAWTGSWNDERPPKAIALRLRLTGGETMRTTVIPAVRRRA